MNVIDAIKILDTSAPADRVMYRVEWGRPPQHHQYGIVRLHEETIQRLTRRSHMIDPDPVVSRNIIDVDFGIDDLIADDWLVISWDFYWEGAD